MGMQKTHGTWRRIYKETKARTRGHDLIPDCRGKGSGNGRDSGIRQKNTDLSGNNNKKFKLVN
jgi:hypothetical protein